ncbi:MAG: sel1 repeat family protein [gamma proteobacterium symbiont of Bathyaustriella thionipta]|nr:sel1 repeat family protein [gamma proteobacterium symbiont of Bathyaustriella thionipta]MCU7950008.1 sel1 repeat family protein [gamma proteobacterium symbiont of Bathyaustriella thionipta]MCU7953807.1 sel1 repeat family protein [gamma proteobacterium symbiont of Bathyaustriella thionipta]MCU7956604.1 sel1 repeat family protein [gamma proteobacterium symbiont of Bathyaustriella thionipta]MCU7968604.1 sel1 repeat family protein [gamma proteobacterium symbiont of Bathyaustriella thionipta]
MKNKYFLFGLLLWAISSVSYADINHEVRHAQKLLSKGQYEQALNKYQQVAKEKNNPLAKFTLAMFYDNGWGRPVDPVKACQWYDKAAQDDIPKAADALGRCLSLGIHREVDIEQAAFWYQKAADLGHHYSLCHLGALYISGKGIKKDTAKGLALCQQSAEQGSLPAMLRLAHFYLELDEARNYKSALHWFSMAASYQSVRAQFQLGIMVRDGLGIEKNPLIARSWFEKSASQCYIPAYFQTALLYFNAPANPDTGLWYADDLAKAYLWLSTTIQRSKDNEEQLQAKKRLEKIQEVMPQTWTAELDVKLQAHLKKYTVDSEQKQ